MNYVLEQTLLMELTKTNMELHKSRYGTTRNRYGLTTC